MPFAWKNATQPMSGSGTSRLRCDTETHLQQPQSGGRTRPLRDRLEENKAARAAVFGLLAEMERR
jgi:hypothetical protein